MKYNSHKRSMLKSVVWRTIGIFILAFLSFYYTGHWIQTGWITLLHHTSFVFIFYFHERIWLKVRWLSKLKHVVKTITYEIILGNLVLGTFTWLITGDWKKVTGITLTYIAVKLILYPIYDVLWKQRLVYAYFCGDIIHIGHLLYLERAKKLGDYLIAGVLTDKAIMEKKSKPIIPFKERLKTIAALRYVDEVVAQKTYSPLNNVKKLKPDILMESISHSKMPANLYVKNYGGKIAILPYYQEQSSSKIKEKIYKNFKNKK